MYLLFSVVSIFCPLLGIPLGIIGLYGDKKHQKIYVACIALAFAALAYGYQARAETDITRYWQIVDTYVRENISLKDALINGSYGANSAENLWFVNTIFWIASKIKNPRIVPAVSAFCVYYFSLSISITVNMDSGIQKKQMLFHIIFMLMALNFYAIANNVRNVLAFMMISYATFRDIYLKKRNILTLLLYFLPVFIHTSAVIFLILRVLLKPASRIKMISLVVVILLYPLLDILNSYVPQMIGTWKILGNAISKAYRYFSGLSWSEWGVEVQASGSEKIMKIIYIIMMILICALWVLSEKKGITFHMNGIMVIRQGTSLINNYTFYVCMMALACTPMLTPEYWRFSATAIGISGGVFAQTKRLGIRNSTLDLIWIVLLLLSAFGMALWIRNLFIYAKLWLTIISALEASPIIVGFKILVNMFI